MKIIRQNLWNPNKHYFISQCTDIYTNGSLFLLNFVILFYVKLQFHKNMKYLDCFEDVTRPNMIAN